MKYPVEFYERVVFGTIILGGYILAMGTLAFHEIPETNLQLFTGGIGALGTALGLIVAAIWKHGVNEARTQTTIQTLADKVVPATAPPPGTATVTAAADVDLAVRRADDEFGIPPEPRP